MEEGNKIKQSREMATEEIAKAIINGEIDYEELQNKKSEIARKLGCETPSNQDILKAVEKLDKTKLKFFSEKKTSYTQRKTQDYHSPLSNYKYYPLLIFLALWIYYVYFININFFIDWDTIAVAISMKNGDFHLLTSFVNYHMIIQPIVYLLNSLSSPFFGLDFLIGWKILVSLGAAATGTMLYITVYRLTKSHLNAFIVMAALAGTYGYLFLTLSLEANIVNSFFNMVFIFFLLVQLDEIKLETPIVAEKKIILSILTGVSLGLAIATAMFSMIYIPLILTIFYFKRENGLAENIKEVLSVAAGSMAVIVPILIINAYAYNWHSINDLVGYFTVGYLKDPNYYYFANPNGNIWNQFEFVNWGLTSLFFQRFQELMSLAPNFLSISPFLLSILAFVFLGFVLSSIRTRTTQILIFMLLIMIPFFMFYESWSIERWFNILLPIYTIVGYSLKTEKNTYGKGILTQIKNFYAEHGIKITVIITIILFIFTISSFNAISNFQENPVHKLADEINQKTPGNALVIIDVSSTSELGLYVKYKAQRELLFIGDVDRTELLNYIDSNLSKNRPIYISTIAAGILMQSNPELKTKYSYEMILDNGYYSLYNVHNSSNRFNIK